MSKSLSPSPPPAVLTPPPTGSHFTSAPKATPIFSPHHTPPQKRRITQNKNKPSISINSAPNPATVTNPNDRAQLLRQRSNIVRSMRDRANHFTTPLGLHELRLVERDVRQRTAEEEETRAHSGEEMREEKKNVNADTGLGRDDASKAREFDNPLMFSGMSTSCFSRAEPAADDDKEEVVGPILDAGLDDARSPRLAATVGKAEDAKTTLRAGAEDGWIRVTSERIPKNAAVDDDGWQLLEADGSDGECL